MMIQFWQNWPGPFQHDDKSPTKLTCTLPRFPNFVTRHIWSWYKSNKIGPHPPLILFDRQDLKDLFLRRPKHSIRGSSPVLFLRSTSNTQNIERGPILEKEEVLKMFSHQLFFKYNFDIWMRVRWLKMRRRNDSLLREKVATSTLVYQITKLQQITLTVTCCANF